MTHSAPDPVPFSRATPADATPRGASPLPLVGERLGVWRIVAGLYEVGSGHWFRVEHALATGETALAIVYRSEADAQAVLMRFAEDSEALARASVTGFGPPLDSGLSPGGSPYLVVPAMEGAPLMRVAMALPLRRRMELLLELVALLDVAQARGLVLHELDPGMLWLSPSQQLCWLGQGLAPRGSQAPPVLVRSAEPLADPRQRTGLRPDAASEAYALGRLLGLLINGRLPRREGPADARADAVAVEVSATPVASLQSWLSLSAAHRESLDRLLDRAMTDGQTFPDRTALAQAVNIWLDEVGETQGAFQGGSQGGHPGRSGSGMAPAAHPGSAGAGARPSAPMPLSAPATAPTPLKPPGASVVERIAGALAVLAVAAVLVWLLLRSN